MYRKLLFLFVILTALPMVLLPFRVFVWDNDANLYYYDSAVEKEVGCEYGLVNALRTLNIDYRMDTILPGPDELAGDYDALYIVCGYRSPREEILSKDEADIIYSYLRDYNGRVYVEGNNFVEFLSQNYPALLKLFGIKLDTDSKEIVVDTLIGAEGSILSGLSFGYPHGDRDTIARGCDNIVFDDQADGIKEMFLYQPTEDKFYHSRGSAYAGLNDNNKGDTTIAWKTFVSTVTLGAVLPESKRAPLIDKTTQYFGNVKVLIVNDAPGEDPDYTEAPYVYFFRNHGYDYDIYRVKSNDEDGPSEEIMTGYTLVVWFTGANYTNPLTQNDLDNIGNYLTKTARQIMLFSPGTAISLGQAGAGGREAPFLSVILGIDYLDMEELSQSITGVDGNYLQYLRGVKINRNYGDRESYFLTVGTGKGLMYSDNSKNLIACSNVDTVYGFKSVYFTVNLEDMDNPAKSVGQDTVMYNSVVGFMGLPDPNQEALSINIRKDKEMKKDIPSNDKFEIYALKGNLFVNSGMEGNLYIYDITGRMETNFKIEKGKSVYNIHLLPGVYYGKLGNEKQKFIVLP